MNEKNVSNFIKDSVKDITGAIAYKIKHPAISVFVPNAIQNERIRICEICPSNFFNSETRRCQKCRCHMDFKTKLSGFKCPKNHWKDIKAIFEIFSFTKFIFFEIIL